MVAGPPMTSSTLPHEWSLAAQTLERAEQLFPRYPYTLGNLARVRIGQNRASDAVQLWTEATLVDRPPPRAL
jgi:Flp pilus assembly protein TadD